MSYSTLYLCEKHSQAKALAKHIGADTYAGGAWHSSNEVVVAAQGHLLELATINEYIGAGKWKIEDLPVLPQEWVLQQKSDEKARERFQTIGHYLKMVGHVVVATDPDDEGELIARDILNAHGYMGKASRLWASALNPDALQASLDNLLPLSATEGYFRAASIRRKLDWLFGMNLSRAFSVQFDKTTHIGRVKTRLLSELVKRDLAIETFRPARFHEVSASAGGAELRYVSGLPGPVLLGDEMVHALNGLRGIMGTVVSTSEHSFEVHPPLTYTLSGLLVDAAGCGIGLYDGYSAAQSLYEAGAISYPRTGSTSLPSAQNMGFAAHSAIVTTGDLPAGASRTMSDIYGLIQANLRLQELGAALVNQRTAVVNFGGYAFEFCEKWIAPGCEGFVSALSADHPLHAEYQPLLGRSRTPGFAKGARVKADEVRVAMRETARPQPFNEASMLKMMAENNIGTEATRVSAINSLVRDGVATASTVTDATGKELREPTMLRSTVWAQALFRNLPGEVTGVSLNKLVVAAQNEARRGRESLDDYLLDAAKLILRVLPQIEPSRNCKRIKRKNAVICKDFFGESTYIVHCNAFDTALAKYKSPLKLKCPPTC